MAAGDILLIPVDSEQHIHCLKEYRKMLQSTMGPRGSCKAIVTGGGYFDITCACSTLASRLELASPVCKYINNMAVGRVDHGLYCAILLSQLLEHQLMSPESSKRTTEQAIVVLVEHLKKLFFSENVCVKLNFDSIQNLVPLVRTVIKSKCPALLSGMEIDGLCVEVIRVFLNCVDEETNVINRIHLKVESGLNTFKSCKGLVYTITDSHHIETARGVKGDLKILVFLVKLQDTKELGYTCENLLKVLDNSVQFGVKVIACQQIISPEIKIFLRRKNLIFLERMGSDFTKMLIDVSHAFPISNLNIEDSQMEDLVGHLSSIEHLYFKERDYLVLHSKNMSVATLLIQTSSLLGQENVKALLVQALAALRVAAVHPILILGGGCAETWFIGQIHHLKNGWKDVELSHVATWVQKALQSTCFAEEMDTLYHHGWVEGELYCGCRLMERDLVMTEGGTWVTLQEVVSSQVSLQMPRQPDMTLRPEILVEPQQQKLQVICDVFEAFANLCNVGLIVHEH